MLRKRFEMSFLIVVIFWISDRNTRYFWYHNNISKVQAKTYLSSPSVLLSPIVSSSTKFSKNRNAESSVANLSSISTWIPYATAILVAFIALCGVVYQSRRTTKIEKEKILAQVELERERIRFQDEINAVRAAQERQRQRKEMDAEAVLAAINRAMNIAERDQAYREALHADPRISRLQILDINHPLDVTNIFVRVRLHQETKPGYELDPALLAAEAQRDPNELFRASRVRLENRARSALDPAEAIRNYKRCVFKGDPGAGKTTL